MSNYGYVLGVLAGDGTLVRHRGHYTIRLATASKSFADKFADNISQLTKKKCQQHLRPSFQCHFKGQKTYQCQTQYISKIYSKVWFHRFSQLLREVRNGRFPLPSVEILSFLRGFYDSEGCKNRKSIRLCNQNTKLLELTKQCLNSIGITVSGIYQQQTESVLCIGQKEAITRFCNEVLSE